MAEDEFLDLNSLQYLNQEKEQTRSRSTKNQGANKGLKEMFLEFLTPSMTSLYMTNYDGKPSFNDIPYGVQITRKHLEIREDHKDAILKWRFNFETDQISRNGTPVNEEELSQFFEKMTAIGDDIDANKVYYFADEK